MKRDFSATSRAARKLDEYVEVYSRTRRRSTPRDSISRLAPKTVLPPEFDFLSQQRRGAQDPTSIS